MMSDSLEITPKVTVHNLLETYPELEDVLIGIAPPFKKLKNPILRKSVAKVATLQHIASVANISLTDLIATLREAIGQSPTEEIFETTNYFTEQPDWFNVDKIAVSLNESMPDNPDEMSIVRVIRASNDLITGDIIELITTFVPAPGIEKLKERGFQTWTTQENDGIIKNYFLKSD